MDGIENGVSEERIELSNKSGDSGIHVVSRDKQNGSMENEEVETNVSPILMTEGSSELFDEEETISKNHSNEGDVILDKEMANMEKQDSEDEDATKSNKENIHKSHKSKKSQNKASKPKKKTKKEIKDERMKIRSETQRLMRESEISIPYHVPKQRTLREFLARKKVRADIPINLPASQMKEVWKEIEENTKKAFEFFKSDSESDGEGGNDNEGTDDKNDERFEKKSYKSYKSDKGNKSSISDGCEKPDSNLTNENLGSGNDKQSTNENDCMILFENTATDSNDDGHESIKCSESKDKEDGNNNNKSNLDSDEDKNKEDDEEKIALERTSDWVKNIPAYEQMLRQNKKEMLLQKLNPQLLNITPKLSGTPDSFIDLENDEKNIQIGARNLKKRFLENCLGAKNKPKQDVELTITTSEKNDKGDIINVETEKLIYTSPEILKNPELDKPGAKLQRLREELKKKIEEKWEEGYMKQLEEERIEAETRKFYENEEVDDEEIIEDDEEEEDEEEDEDEEVEEVEPDDEEDDENDECVDKKKRNCFLDSEAEESGEEVSEDGKEDIDNGEREDQDKEVFSVDECSNTQSSFIPPYQPGGGMLHGGSELTQKDDGISIPTNLLSQSLLDFSPVKETGTQQSWDVELLSPEESNTGTSFVPRFPENKNFDLNDAYEFCSGKFPGEGESQDAVIVETNSQDLVTTPDNSLLNFTPLENSIAKENAKKRRTRIIVSDDSEDEIDRDEVEEVEQVQNITKKRISLNDSDSESVKSVSDRNRKPKKNLTFSDDEDEPEVVEISEKEDKEEDEAGGDDDDDDDDDDVSSLNGDDPFVEDKGIDDVLYNSEEEVINPGEYFEKEAELSGSECSGDEDEKDMDLYEKEEGDEEVLDEEELKSEIGKIHMRTVLDDDARKVRMLQEILFEDGDLYDDNPQQRKKLFRWKDMGDGFEDDDEGRNSEDGSQSQDEIEEDEEARKIRHEKELFLMKLRNDPECGDDDVLFGTSLLKKKRVIVKNLAINTGTTKTVSRTVRTEVQKLSVNSPASITYQRASFLARDEKFLSKLAQITSNTSDNIFGPKHSKNFVFAAKSPQKDKESSNMKRKNDSPKEKQTKKSRMVQPTTSSSKQ